MSDEHGEAGAEPVATAAGATPEALPPVGQLSAEQEKVARRNLRPHLNRGCVICGGKNFQLGGLVHGLPYSQDGALVMGGPRVPLLLVVCAKCFNVQLYAAVIVAGVK